MFSSKKLVSQSLLTLQARSNIGLVLKASICHKSELPVQNTYHWPYEKSAWNFTNLWRDPFTKKKFNENSKIIQIEGNVASGKKDFGRRLANELGMKFMDDIDLDSYYVNDHGFDYRSLNSMIPERLRHCDWQMFHEYPSRHSIVHMQFFIFKLRVFQYVKALQHLFNTGQGVILSRSCFTERVFVEAMHDLGWLPQGYLRSDGIRFYDYRIRYINMRNMTLSPLPKPHLTIYLKAPVDNCIEKIRNSSDPVIANSNALTPEFLEKIEQAYEDIVIPKQDQNGHVLQYDYPSRMSDDEISDVIDDIKGFDYEFDWKDTRFDDWKTEDISFWHFIMRREFTNNRVIEYVNRIHQPWDDIAGLGDSISEVDIRLRYTLYEGNVATTGHFYCKDTDLQVQPWYKVLVDRRNFGEMLRSAVYCDFA